MPRTAVSWRQCSFHSIAYKPSDGCALCKKQVEKSLYQHVLDIKNMLQDGFINKEPLVKINSELTDEIGKVINIAKEIRKMVPTHLSETLDMFIDQVRSLNQVKKQLSDLL